MGHLICRLFGHAVTKTCYAPWRPGTRSSAWRTVTVTCPRCEEVVRQWLETSEVAP